METTTSGKDFRHCAYSIARLIGEIAKQIYIEQLANRFVHHLVL